MEHDLQEYIEEAGMNRQQAELLRAQAAAEADTARDRELAELRAQAGREGPAGWRPLLAPNTTPLADGIALLPTTTQTLPPWSGQMGDGAVGNVFRDAILRRMAEFGQEEDAPPALPRCCLCGGAGYYKEAVSYGHPHFGKLFPCRCKLEEQAGRTESHRSALLAGLEAELGPQLVRCTFDNFDLDRPISEIAHGCAIPEQRAQIRRAYVAACEYAEAPRRWLAFFGTPGTGKSHLTAAIAGALARRHIKVIYARVPAQLRFIKDGFDDGTAAARVRALMEVPVLVLDDLGTEQRTDYNTSMLLELVQHRYDQQLATIFTSNVARERIEFRVADRIDELARIVSIVATSYRAEMRKLRGREEDTDDQL